jgi:hypothetical protein
VGGDALSLLPAAAMSKAEKARKLMGLSLKPTPDAPPPVPGLGVSSSPLVAKLQELELNTEYKLSLSLAEIRDQTELGAGNGGFVFKALHIATGLTIAHKVRKDTRGGAVVRGP